jgi:acyl-ACP thioesterase
MFSNASHNIEMGGHQRTTQDHNLTRIPHFGKMCKDKRNNLNMITRKFHIDIDHHNSLYDLMIEKCNKHHLPKKFNTKFYEVVKSF